MLTLQKNRIVLTLIVLCSVALLPARASIASDTGLRDQPPPLAGWTHTQTYPDDTAQKHGVVVSGEDIVRASPTIAEIDGNSGNGKEVVVGGQDGQLYVYRANGQLAWSKNVLPAGCSLGGLDWKLNSTAAVGAIYGDGVPYVVVGYGTVLPSNCDGGIAVYRGSDGTLAWRFSTRAWRDSQGYPPEGLYGVMSSPSLYDVDGDGDLEIGFGGFDRNIYLLNSDGSVRWYYFTADTVWSSPAFYDVNGDGVVEMIIGSDISANAQAGTTDGGYVLAFNTAERAIKRVEFCAPNFPNACAVNYLWRVHFDQTIYASPVIADVLASNPGPEIIIGSGCFFPTGSTQKTGRWVKLLRPSDGAVVQTLNSPTCLSASVAVGDLDDDGALEVVANVSGTDQHGGDGASKLIAWKPANPAPWWTFTPRDPNSGLNDAYGSDIQSPVIADLDGNGSLEVMVGNFWSVHVVEGSSGRALSCQGPSASCGAQKSLFTWKTLKSTPAVGDINNDGKLDLVIGSGNVHDGSARGRLYAWTDLNFGSATGKQRAYSAPWPMFRGDPAHGGVFGAKTALTLSTKAPFVLAQIGGTQNTSIRITVDSSVTWKVVKLIDANAIVAIDTPSGQGNGDVKLTFNLPSQPGTYTARIAIQPEGLPEEIVEITFKVVTQLRAIYLPLTRR